MPGDIARLVIEIDSNGVVTGKARLDDLTDAGKKAEDQNKKHKTSLIELNQGLELAGKAFRLLQGAMVESVAEFVEAEKAQVKLEAILRATGQAAGRTADDLNNMSARLAGKTIFDDDSISNAQALMLTFKNIKGSIYDETIPAVLDLSSAFGMDLAGASVMLGKALEDPTTGLTALRRVGVSFTEAEQDQIKAMTAAGDAAQAQGVILDVLKGQVGGVADAMGASASGSIVRMENAIDNLKEAFGRMIATNFQPLIDNLTHTMDVMSGTKIDVGELVGGAPGQWRGKVNGATDAQLAFMVQDIDANKKLPWFRAGTDLGKALSQLESLVLLRIDELKKAGKFGNSGAGTPFVAPLMPYTGGSYGVGESMLGFQQPDYGPQDSPDIRISRFDPFSGFDKGGAYQQDGYGQVQGGPGNATENMDEWRRGNVSKMGVDQDKIDSVLKLADAWNIADSSAADFSKAMELVDKAMKAFAARGIAEGFQDIGAAMAGSSSAGADFGAAMAKAGLQLAEQIGGMMIAAGLKGMIEQPGGTMNPLNWALIAAGGGLAMAGGYLGEKSSPGSSGARSALSASQSASSSSSAPLVVNVQDYAGVGIKVTERQTPSGKELQIAVRNIVAGEIAGGGLDRVAGQRWGVATPGRSAS